MAKDCTNRNRLSSFMPLCLLATRLISLVAIPIFVITLSTVAPLPPFASSSIPSTRSSLTLGISIPSHVNNLILLTSSSALLRYLPGGGITSNSDFCGEHFSPVPASCCSIAAIASCSELSMWPSLPPGTHSVMSPAYTVCQTCGIPESRLATPIITRLNSTGEITAPWGVPTLPSSLSGSSRSLACSSTVRCDRKSRM